MYLTHGTPWTEAGQASLSFTISWSLLKLMSIELLRWQSQLPRPWECPFPQTLGITLQEALQCQEGSEPTSLWLGKEQVWPEGQHRAWGHLKQQVQNPEARARVTLQQGHC